MKSDLPLCVLNKTEKSRKFLQKLSSQIDFEFLDFEALYETRINLFLSLLAY